MSKREGKDEEENTPTALAQAQTQTQTHEHNVGNAVSSQIDEENVKERSHSDAVPAGDSSASPAAAGAIAAAMPQPEKTYQAETREVLEIRSAECSQPQLPMQNLGESTNNQQQRQQQDQEQQRQQQQLPHSASNKRKTLSNLMRRPPVDISFSNVGLTIREGDWLSQRCKEGKTILQNVTGKFKSGELVAIMGPSGAGKSTLMNVMAGYRVSGVTGQIKINGKIRDLRKFRKISCYIMQDDCLAPHLTVREAMWVAANLKLGEKRSTETKWELITEILENLGLSECLDTRTSKVSGGQRKRLAIALELVNNPPVMFLDEPTSGLDSSSCAQCIALLKQLAREGRTIVCTIHQPSARIFEMFDKLYLMGEGHNIYRGAVGDLIQFLSELGLNCPSYHNPADFVMEICTGEYGRHIETLVDAVHKQNMREEDEAMSRKQTEGDKKKTEQVSAERKTTKQDSSKKDQNSCAVTIKPQHEPDESKSLLEFAEAGSVSSDNGNGSGAFPTSTGTQFRILFVRTFRSIVRDHTLTNLRITSHVVVGLILGFLYFDIGNEASKVYNNSAMLFFCMLFSMFAAMMPTLMTFPLEITTFKREHLNHWYSMKSYYLAKTMADMPFQIAYPVVFVAIVYVMTSQPLEASRIFMFLGMCVLTSLVAQSMGLVIGCAFDVQSAVFMGPITTIPILLFSGFFVSLDNIPTVLQWLTYVAYVRYGFEGGILAIYGFDREKLHCSVPYCHFKYPTKFLEELAMNPDMFWVDVGCLIGIFVALRTFGYFVLRFRVRVER